MNTKTLKALKGSIEKWKKIERNTRALDKSTINCSLCRMFWDKFDCKGCPVMKKTKRRYCVGTPFVTWEIHHIKTHMEEWDKFNHRHKDCPTCLALATAERKFLESLLPTPSTSPSPRPEPSE